MLHSRIPVQSRVLLALGLGLGIVGMAVLGLLLVSAEHARAAQAPGDTELTHSSPQGAPNLDVLRRETREYAREQRGAHPPLAGTHAAGPDQGSAQISGRLVAGATGVGNTQVILRTYRPSDNLGDRPVMTATTSITGAFVFASPLTLPTGYAYYVEFGPQTSNTALAYLWNSDDITSYTAGQQVSVGTLDVANVPLIAPANNATVSFPVTFEWTPRARTTDNYVVFREDLSGNFAALSPPLGHVDRYTATSGNGSRLGEPYLWGIFVDNTADNGSFGLSQRRTITFTDSPVQATSTTTATVQTTVTPTGAATAQTTGTATPTSTTGACLSGTVQINIQNFAFVPATVTVCQGATVRWTNLDTAPHTSTSDTGVWDSGTLNTGQSFSFTFNTVGSFPYHCTIHPNMHGTINVVAGPTATVTATATPTVQTTGTPTVLLTGTTTPQATGTATVQTTGTATAQATDTATVQATGTATVQATGTATVQATGTATVQTTGTATVVTTGTPTPQTTGTATAQATGTATVQATGTATVGATGTATLQATGTATVQATGTATLAPTSTALPATGTPTATMTATAQATRTATVQPTGTATVRPTGTPFTCGGGNLCAGVVVVRAFIDFGCDGFFNRGTDYPLYGATVTATLPDGTRLVSIVDENGNAVISGINLAATDSIQVSIDSPPLPTWVQQASLGLAPCGTSPTTMTLQRSNFGLFGVAFTDFRFGLTRP